MFCSTKYATLKVTLEKGQERVTPRNQNVDATLLSYTRMDGYHKSVIDVKIQFDKDKESEFRNWLDKEYKLKTHSGSNQGSIHDLLAIRPSHLSRFLDEDFSRRETEVDSFRKVSLNALASPLLTKALVKKTTEKLANVQVTAKDHWQPIEKFRWTARIILVLVSAACRWRRYAEKWCKGSVSGASVPRLAPTTGRMTRRKTLVPRQSILSKSSGHFSFDMSEFSKNNSRVPPDLQEALTKPPPKRTQAELIRIQKFCRGLGVLSNFPVNRELDASRLIGYERYDQGRVMCLQGRLPQRFYYILAGRVLKERSISLTSGIDKKYFGELHKGQTTDAEELQSQKKRDCSLVCTSAVEVLLFEKEDFMELLNSKENEEDNTSSFLSTIDIFKTFPVEELAEESEAVITKYFPKDAIIVSDLQEAEHLYVIKSGLCRILRKLLVDEQGLPVKSRHRGRLPSIHDSDMVTTKTSSSSARDLEEYDLTIEEAKRIRYQAKLMLNEVDMDDEVWGNGSRRSSHGDVMTAELTLAEIDREEKREKATKAETTRRSRKRAKRRKAQDGKGAKHCKETRKDYPELKLPLLTGSSSLTASTPPHGSSTGTTSTARGACQSESSNHSLLHLGSLKRGDVYGIDAIVRRAWSIVQSNVPLPVAHFLPDLHNLILLSEGAECILIKKTSFLQKADFFTLAKIVSSNGTRPPNEREILGVDRDRAWKSYKKSTVDKVVQNKQIHL